MKAFPLVEVGGPPFERGYQHGRACGDLIRRYPAILRLIWADDPRLSSAGSAELAYILCRVPVLVAVHASRMLAGVSA